METYSKAYIAGFFDGEGSIGIYGRRNGSCHALRTQLTQNKNEFSTKFFNFLVEEYGGNLSEQISLSGRIKYNWQLNASGAVLFLRSILQFLHAKLEQALIAIRWQESRPAVHRDKKGRVRVLPLKYHKLNRRVSLLLKELKTIDWKFLRKKYNDISNLVEDL